LLPNAAIALAAAAGSRSASAVNQLSDTFWSAAGFFFRVFHRSIDAGIGYLLSNRISRRRARLCVGVIRSIASRRSSTACSLRVAPEVVTALRSLV
jgi:hypothetical protein